MVKEWTEEECLEFLKEEASNGEIYANDIRGGSGPSVRTYQRKFGSWNNAKAAAGLETIENHIPENGIDGSEYFNKILDWSSCARCGESDNACIQFHHVNQNKRFNISTANQPGSTWSSSTVHKELQKCIPLCANCHSRHHSDRHDFNADNVTIRDWPEPTEMHATNQSDRTSRRVNRTGEHVTVVPHDE
jgi:hypothetical protein